MLKLEWPAYTELFKFVADATLSDETMKLLELRCKKHEEKSSLLTALLQDFKYSVLRVAAFKQQHPDIASIDLTVPLSFGQATASLAMCIAALESSKEIEADVLKIRIQRVIVFLLEMAEKKLINFPQPEKVNLDMILKALKG